MAKSEAAKAGKADKAGVKAAVESRSGHPAIAHASVELPSVTIDHNNVEAKDEDGFIGDKVSKSGFREIVDTWRETLRGAGPDPLGDEPSAEISKKDLDALLLDDDPVASGILFSAVEEFSQELASVIRRFLRVKGWADTQAIVVGGGFSDSVIGRLAIARSGAILRAAGLDLSLKGIENHPDEAGLIGAAHLAPAWIFAGYDSLLAVDIGGSNIRAGLLITNQKKAPDLSRAEVWRSELWRHADEKPAPTRDQAVTRLTDMLEDLIRRAEREGLALAPLIGVGCPGIIEPDGDIARGGHNLPGDWESGRFNLPDRIIAKIPRIGSHDTMVVMHNDAVVQGLSEAPRMRHVERWGVLTIGTGLGNARFTNRTAPAED